MKFLYDPQSISRVTWQLISNNLITPSIFMFLTIAEGLQSIFYAFLLQQQLVNEIKLDLESGLNENQITNGETDSSDAPASESSSIQISLLFINDYQKMLTDNENFVMVTSASIFGLNFFLGLIFTYLLWNQKKKMIKDLSESSMIHKVFGCLLIIYARGLYLITFEFIIRGYSAYQQYDLGIKIGLSITNTISVVLFFFFIFYTRRIFKLNMLSNHISWSNSDSKAIYFGFFAKIINPLILSFDTNGDYITAEIIICLIIQTLYLVMILFFADIYNRKIDLVQKFIQATVVLILEISFIKYLIKENDGKEFILFLCVLPFHLYFIYRLNKRRKEQILEMFTEGKLKMELQFEYLLIYLYEIVQDSLIDSKVSQEYYSEILKLLEGHQLTCYNTDCICTKQGDFMEIFKQGQKQSTNVFLVELQNLKKIKEYIQMKSGKWFVSSVNRMKEDQFRDKYYNKRDIDDDEEDISLIDDQSNDDGGFLNSLDIQDATKQIRIRPKRKIKIDIQHVKRRFVTNFILLFFVEIKQKFPNSLKIHILCNYYSMMIVQKPQLCISQLRGFNDKNFSWLDRISKFVNEFYILDEYEKHDKSNLDSNMQIKVDGEHFIMINDLYEEFQTQVDQMSFDAVEFWKGFTQDDVDPYKQYDLGEKIADSIQATYKTFKEIEDNLIQKDYKIYVWFAQIQLKIMNDNDGYQIFIQKMRGVMQMNKMFQSNMRGKISEDSGFIVSDGHSNNSGKILFMNKTIKRWLLREEDDTKFLNINALMPKLIGERHDEFMKKYNETGESVILNKQILNFLMDKNGSIFPAEMLIKFHYSQKFKYCFITFIEKVKTIKPFIDMVKYKTEQLLFMTIDMYDGQIFEVSRNLLNLLEYFGINQYKDIREISFTEKKRLIQDLLTDFSFEELTRYKQTHKNKNDSYEKIHTLNLFSFSDNIDYYGVNSTKDECQAKVAIYVDTYGECKLNIGFVVLSISTGHQNLDFINELKSNDAAEVQQQEYKDEQQEMQLRESQENDSVASSSCGSSNSGSSSSSYHALQQFHTFYRQQTPRILKIVIQLILLMFIASITIATVNLVLNIRSHNLSELEVKQVRASMDRVNFSVSIRLLLRTMMNIANGYEPNKSKLLDDRFKVYQGLLRSKAEQLISAQYYLDNSGYQFSQSFENELKKSEITLSYLMENNVLRKENVTMRNMQSLYGSRLVQVENYTMQQMKGNLKIQNLKPNLSVNYQPTIEEQTLYFIVENGNGIVRTYNRFFADLYITDSVKNSENNESNTMITTVISVITIFLVTCVISPIISKTEERKYNALVFFMRIPRNQVEQYIKSCQECQNLDASPNIQKKEKNTVNNVPNEDFKTYDYQSMNYPQDHSVLDVSDVQLMQENSFNQSNNLESTQKRLFEENSVRNELINTNARLRNYPQKSSDTSVIGGNEESKYLSMANLQRRKNKQINHANLSISDSSEKPNDLKSLQNKQIKVSNEQQEQQIRDQEILEELMNRNLQKIKGIAFKKKTLTFLFVMVLMVVFSVYFIISFFMAQKNYQTAANSSIDLGTIFSKEQCFENLISYQRENMIQNKTIMLTDNITEASQYFLTTCSTQEAKYKELRKSLPEYFQDAKQYLEQIETNKYCDVVYVDSLNFLNSPCQIALNGLMSKGMTNTLFYMLSQAQKTELAFKNSYQNQRRDDQFLRVELNSTDVIDIIDTKMYIMGYSFIELENQCMESALKYFKKLLTDFIIVYAVFLALLISSMIYFTIFAFKRLRRSMWSTNMLLKIIPKQALNKNDSELLKQFFVN
ncbi:pas domain s-box family protein [Stylonychia lemnae]|uniref:Pas domain s-box family protein n=1 Tax=Stylonychia lemnae TaxID=5949 RepID=A0A078A7B0_STYLE|nr:pas domain s-box family protein [Stylonychia lemnae]|eukprot:CDW76681.1 pas domain s-box family protein [Stylonychia lemnae]